MCLSHARSERGAACAQKPAPRLNPHQLAQTNPLSLSVSLTTEWEACPRAATPALISHGTRMHLRTDSSHAAATPILESNKQSIACIAVWAASLAGATTYVLTKQYRAAIGWVGARVSRIRQTGRQGSDPGILRRRGAHFEFVRSTTLSCCTRRGYIAAVKARFKFVHSALHLSQHPPHLLLQARHLGPL